MANKSLPQLIYGDIAQVVKLTKLRRLNNGKGYSYDYVQACLDAKDVRSNADIIGIAWELVAARERSLAALAQVRTKRQARNQPKH